VNRTIHAAAALLPVLLVAMPARAAAPLVVGSVRDQHGAAIAGATVTGETPGGSHPATTTDASGTFALHADGVVAVVVSCRYCRTTRVATLSGEPVVAIVQQYAALVFEAPTPGDLENLPYSNVESSVALRPFTLLAQTTAPYPGSTLSDRGLSATGSLLIDNGVPNYDITSGQSPYALIPANYAQSAVVRNAAYAFLYGNQAEGGTVQLDPFLGGTNWQVATLGSDTIARAEVGSDASSIAFGTSSNNEESRQRTDLVGTWPLGADQSVTVGGGTEQGRQWEPDSTFAGSFSFADATFSDPRALNLSISALADRGDYALTEGEYPVSNTWSDSEVSAGIHTAGPVAGFADAVVRTSAGIYDQQALPDGLPRLGATLAQTHVDAGLVASGSNYDVVAGIGAFWIGYSGGILGISNPANTSLIVPSLQARLFPKGRWSLGLQQSSSFSLPTLIEQSLYNGGRALPVLIEHNALSAGTLTYTDDARLSLTFQEAVQKVAGTWPGIVSSSGVSATWQVAPAIAVRAWTMHVTDTAALYGGGLPYEGMSPTVNALWATYDMTGGVRADVIYRRDLLNSLPYYHVDGAISGPIAGGVRWYAGAEDRMQRTFVDVGIRFGGR
jgi:hypothetical protein